MRRLLALALALSVWASTAHADREQFQCTLIAPSAQINGDLVYTSTTQRIIANTADASDSKRIQIVGGGSNVVSRGGLISIEGNEYGGTAGAIGLYPGDTTAGHVILEPTNSSAQIRFRHGGSTRWALQSDGTLAQDVSNGSNITLSRANTSIVQRTTTGITAAGTNSANATVLDSVYNVVGTVAASTGVRLTNVTAGGMVWVQNLGANDLEVYPTTGGVINGAATDAGITLTAANDQIAQCVRAATNTWMCTVSNGPAT